MLPCLGSLAVQGLVQDRNAQIADFAKPEQPARFKDLIGPEPPLVRAAVKVSYEPRADLLILCCVHPQRGNCCNSVKFYAAARQEKRSLMRAAAKTKR